MNNFLLPVLIGLIATLCFLTIPACSGQTDGIFEILDEQFTSIIDTDTGLDTLASGHVWSEGPLWLADEEILIYNDIPRNTTYGWSPNSGSFEYLKPSGYTGKEKFTGAEPGANGMVIDDKGNLIMCQHGDRRIARMNAPLNNPLSEFVTVAGAYNGKRLNSPNDLTMHSKGTIFFTDPPYGLPGQMDDEGKELPYQGVYRIDPDGSVALLSKSFTRPNGIALSPDESKLYVANSDPEAAYWKVFEIGTDHEVVNEQLFRDVTDMVGSLPGLPDGLKVDSDGIIYASGPGGIFIFHPDGTLLGRILTGQATSNCALDDEETYLYITADMYVFRVKLR